MNVLDLFRLDGKTALVTGCRRGIGKAMAVALAQAGANIVGVSASLESEGSEVEQEVRAAGRLFYPYRCDLGDRRSLSQFIEQVRADCLPIDILINNAGAILRQPATDHSDDLWDKVIEVNLSAPFVLSRELGKDMLARGHGKIVFIASLLTFQGGINVPGYAASKGGVGQLVMALSNEWAGRGVQVNGLAPGYVSTDNTQALREDPARSEQILARIPAGRWGQPEDYMGPVVFLSSAASDYLSGHIMVVDGGWMGR